MLDRWPLCATLSLCVFFIILIFTAFTTGALAQCPKPPEISEELDEAYRSLKFAKFPRDAQAATAVLWSLWTRAPDNRAQRLLNRGMMNLRLGDLAAAEGFLSALIEVLPRLRRGLQSTGLRALSGRELRRGLARFGSRALSIRPRHLGALSGKGLTHLALGQPELAEIEFRKELALNPFTADRDLIPNLGTDL